MSTVLETLVGVDENSPLVYEITEAEMGIGASKTRENRAKIARILNKQTARFRDAVVTENTTPSQRFMAVQATKNTGKDTQAAIANRNAKFGQLDLLHSAIFSGIGQNQILDLIAQGNKVERGISDFGDGEMPNSDGQITHVKLSYGFLQLATSGLVPPIPSDVYTASAVDADSNTTSSTVVPAQILKSKLIIKVGDRELDEMYLSQFFRPTLSMAANLELLADGLKLAQPVAFKKQEKVSFQIKTPARMTALPATSGSNTLFHQFDIRLICDYFRTN